MKKYRIFIQDGSHRARHLRFDEFHFQFTAKTMPEAWKQADLIVKEYRTRINQNCALIPRIKIDVKARHLSVRPLLIGNAETRSIMIQKLKDD